MIFLYFDLFGSVCLVESCGIILFYFMSLLKKLEVLVKILNFVFCLMGWEFLVEELLSLYWLY